MATKNFIQGAIKRPGALHEKLGVKKGEKIPASKLKSAASKPGLLGKEARFAETLRKINKPRSIDDLRKIAKSKGVK